MAEVTGTLNGEPIELNNAATELTLKQLLAATLAMAASKGLTQKAQKELEADLKKLSKSTKKLTETVDDETAAKQKAAKELEKRLKAEEESTKTIRSVSAGLNKLGSTVVNVATGMTGLISNLSKVGNSLTSAAGSLDSIPVFGSTLSTVFGAVAGAAEKSYKAFQDSASVGANFGGSITDMIDSATSAGLTFDDFTSIIKENSESLTLLGGSSANGAKRLAEMGKSIKNSALGDQLAGLGYTTADINSGMAKYSGMLGRTSGLQGKTNAQLISGTGNYLKQLDAVAKLTGKNREVLEQEQEARLTDAQFRSKLSKLGDDAANAQTLISSLPKELQKGAMEVFTTGTATTKAGEQFLTLLPDAAAKFASAGKEAERTGKFSAAAAGELQGVAKRNAQAIPVELLDTVARFNEDMNDTAIGIYELRNQTGNLTDAQKQTAEQAANDAKILKDAQEKIASTSNEFTKVLVNSGLLDELMGAFKLLADFTMTYIVPGFRWLSDHIGTVAIVAGVFAGLMGILNGIIFVSNLRMAAMSLGYVGILPMLAGMAAGLASVLVPLLPFVIAAGALYIAFKALQQAGWDVGTVFQAIGDNFKRLMLKVAEGFLWLLDKVTWGDANKKIKQAQDAVALGQKELDDREKARDDKRKQNRVERAQKEQEEEASKKLVEAKKEEKSAIESITKPSVDYGNTLAILKDQQKAQTQPGATSAAAGGLASTVPSGPVQMPSAAPADIQKYLQATALIESGGRADAKAGTSSAGGLFQFTDGTWKQMVKEMGKDYKVEDKFDPKKASEVMAYFTQKQKGQLEKGIGRDASNTDLYMAHFLGAGGATKFLKGMSANPNQSAAALDPAAAKANKNIYYDKSGNERSLQEVYALMGKKMEGAEKGVETGKWGGKAIPEIVTALGDANAKAMSKLPPTSKEAANKVAASPSRPMNNAEVIAAAQAKYKAEREAELKQAGIPKTPDTRTTPSQSQVAEAAQSNSQTNRDKIVAEKQAKEREERAAKEKEDQTKAKTAASTTQESAETLLASLNTKMDQLVNYMAQTTTNTYQQVAATKGLSQDLYKAV